MNARNLLPAALAAASFALAGCQGIPVSGAPSPRPPGDATSSGPETGTAPPAPGPAVVGAPISTRQAAALDALLINTRDLLLLAPDVARIRWNARQTDPSPDNDRRVVEDAVAQAPLYKLDAALVRDFMRAQVEASRYVQTSLFKQWRDAGTVQLTLTRTAAQVQSASDSLSPQLLASLAAAAPLLKTPGIRAVIESRANELMPTKSALSDPTRAIAIRPLLDRAAP